MQEQSIARQSGSTPRSALPASTSSFSSLPAREQPPLPHTRPAEYSGATSANYSTVEVAGPERNKTSAPATNAPLRRQKTSLANIHTALATSGSHVSEIDASATLRDAISAQPIREKGGPLAVSKSSLGRRVSLFGISSHNSLQASSSNITIPARAVEAPVSIKSRDTSSNFKGQGLLSRIAAQSQMALEGSDASAMAINSQNFACLQDSQSMPPRKEPSPIVSHPNITKLSSSSESSNSSTDSSPSSSGKSKAKPVVKEVKMTYAKKTSLKRKILQSEDDPETQEAESPKEGATRLVPVSSVANIRKSTWVKMPGLEEAASFVSMRKQQKGEVLHPDPDRVAHSSDTDYSDPINLKAPSIRANRRSTSPLTSLDSEGGSRPNSRDQDITSKPSSSPELLEPPSKVQAAPVRTVARTRRGVSGSPPPPTRRAAPKKSLKNGSPDSSTSADDSNDLDYGAGGGGAKAKGKAAAQPAKKKRKTGK